FEKLVEESMKNIEMLKNAHAKGLPVPKCHTQERTFNSPKIYSNLSPNDLVLYITRGVNLPPPSGTEDVCIFALITLVSNLMNLWPFTPNCHPAGVSPNDLDASVKFEFPFPSSVRLFLFLALLGLFKTDKVVGTAQLKLEGLENHCDIREIIEVSVIEMSVKPHGVFFLCLHKAPSPRSKPKHESSSRSSHPDNSPPQYNLHSFSLLNYDKERLERKVCVIPACPPHLFAQGLVAHYCGLAVCRLPEKPSRTPV
ncbi:hypothetical protein XENOCAPTIV_028626, partial [Xenoophorus captivus]